MHLLVFANSVAPQAAPLQRGVFSNVFFAGPLSNFSRVRRELHRCTLLEKENGIVDHEIIEAVSQSLAEPSRVDVVRLRGKEFFIKRDDLQSRRFPGNKYRKLYALIKQGVKSPIISYGGNQSNAMAAIAELAHEFKVPFTYYTTARPAWLRERPIGNLARALERGMQVVDIPKSDFDTAISSARSRAPDSIFIERGGATPLAEEGIAILANEIVSFAAERGLQKLVVVVPSGTGTTSFFLAQHLPPLFEVWTVPAVGDAAYLLAQMSSLHQDTLSKNSAQSQLQLHQGDHTHTMSTNTLPTITISPTETSPWSPPDLLMPLGRHPHTHTSGSSRPIPAFPFIFGVGVGVTAPPFGSCQPQLLSMYHELLSATGVEFDLLYAPWTWLKLLEHLNSRVEDHPPIMYVHTGGTSGNESQLRRYQRNLAAKLEASRQSWT